MRRYLRLNTFIHHLKMDGKSSQALPSGLPRYSRRLTACLIQMPAEQQAAAASEIQGANACTRYCNERKKSMCIGKLITPSIDLESSDFGVPWVSLAYPGHRLPLLSCKETTCYGSHVMGTLSLTTLLHMQDISGDSDVRAELKKQGF